VWTVEQFDGGPGSSVRPMMNVEGMSHVGTTRPTNEDAMTWDLDIGFVAVADGMGGHQAGEVASNLALEAILGFMRKSAATQDFTWPFGVNPQISLTANRLVTALKIGNRRVYKRSEEVPDYTGMGTTVAAVVAEGGHVTFASVGDSRIYTFSDGRLQQLTKDDSWVMMLAEKSGVSAESLKSHPLRNVLTNVLGARPDLEVQAGELDLDGQTLLLCTDGLHGVVSDDQMSSILTREKDLHRAAEELVRIALETSKDNITVVLVRNEAHA
jgi:protein phosphatase